MPVVRKASNRATITASDSSRKSINVTSTRQPSQLEELGDTNFGTLDETKDGMIVSYDSATDKFILITADNVLEDSASDDDLPDVFIDQVESEVDLGTIALDDLDGGAFPTS